MIYAKPALTLSQQVQKLRERGLVVEDQDEAEHFLAIISYYRLSGYMLPFQIVGDTNHRYKDGTNFSDIIALYKFDKLIRNFIFDKIESIENAVKTQIIYNFALQSGSHWQDKDSLYKNFYKFYCFQADIISSWHDNQREVFIDHYKKKYQLPINPPAWMCLEVMTMGQLSRLYTSLKDKETKKKIANFLGFQQLAIWNHGCIILLTLEIYVLIMLDCGIVNFVFLQKD